MQHCKREPTATPQATRLQPSCAPSTRHQHPPTSACTTAYALRCCCNCTPPKDVARASEIQHRVTVLHYSTVPQNTILLWSTCMHLKISLLFSVTLCHSSVNLCHSSVNLCHSSVTLCHSSVNLCSALFNLCNKVLGLCNTL